MTIQWIKETESTGLILAVDVGVEQKKTLEQISGFWVWQ